MYFVRLVAHSGISLEVISEPPHFWPASHLVNAKM
jgi:hypothetical protein